MYTNICTKHAIKIFRVILTDGKFQILTDFLVEKVLEGLKLIIDSNIIKFGDSLFLQRKGTEMGTPCACIYASSYYTYYNAILYLYIYPDYTNPTFTANQYFWCLTDEVSPINTFFFVFNR